MSGKHSVTCQDCGKMYRDFALEGDPTCQCAEKAVRAMKDEITRPRPAMTAVSDETGREQPTHRCKRAGGFVDQNCMALCDCHVTMTIAALSAAPVAQEPVAWMLTWSNGGTSIMRHRPSPLVTGHVAVAPLYAATPPSTPAGVGAEEIARATNWKLVDGTMTTGEAVIFDGSFIIAKVTRREDAELILALLSRAGDQK